MSILKRLGTPIFYAEGQPREVKRENYRLTVDGLLEEGPRTFTFEEIEKMPFSTEDARLTSVSGWSVRANWQGVRFIDFLKYVTPKPGATHVLFESFGGYTTCVPLEKLKYRKVLICYKVDGEYLEIEHGGPMRTFIPHLWGYKSIKGLEKMTFTDHSIPGYWENAGYPDDAQIEPGFTRDINTGKERRIRGGEVMEF